MLLVFPPDVALKPLTLNVIGYQLFIHTFTLFCFVEPLLIYSEYPILMVTLRCLVVSYHIGIFCNEMLFQSIHYRFQTLSFNIVLPFQWAVFLFIFKLSPVSFGSNIEMSFESISNPTCILHFQYRPFFSH